MQTYTNTMQLQQKLVMKKSNLKDSKGGKHSNTAASKQDKRNLVGHRKNGD
jgi:hypothetical protein